jgi:hypothetical protein
MFNVQAQCPGFQTPQRLSDRSAHQRQDLLVSCCHFVSRCVLLRFNETLAHNMELLQTLQESLEEQDNLRNGRRLSNDASELKQQLDIMRAECDKLRQANTQLRDDTVRQQASLQRVVHDLEDETESLREEMRAFKGISVIKNHTELLAKVNMDIKDPWWNARGVQKGI